MRSARLKAPLPHRRLCTMSFCSNVAKNKAAKPSSNACTGAMRLKAPWSELTRGHGMRRSRYRGFGKVELQNLLIGTACNIKRWLRCLITKANNAQSQASGLNLSFQSPRERGFGV